MPNSALRSSRTVAHDKGSKKTVRKRTEFRAIGQEGIRGERNLIVCLCFGRRRLGDFAAALAQRERVMLENLQILTVRTAFCHAFPRKTRPAGTSLRPGSALSSCRLNGATGGSTTSTPSKWDCFRCRQRPADGQGRGGSYWTLGHDWAGRGKGCGDHAARDLHAAWWRRSAHPGASLREAMEQRPACATPSCVMDMFSLSRRRIPRWPTVAARSRSDWSAAVDGRMTASMTTYCDRRMSSLPRRSACGGPGAGRFRGGEAMPDAEKRARLKPEERAAKAKLAAKLAEERSRGASCAGKGRGACFAARELTPLETKQAALDDDDNSLRLPLEALETWQVPLAGQ